MKLSKIRNKITDILMSAKGDIEKVDDIAKEMHHQKANSFWIGMITAIILAILFNAGLFCYFVWNNIII